MTERTSVSTRASKWSTFALWAALAGVLAVLPFLFPAIHATGTINVDDTTAVTTIVTVISPIFKMVQWIVVLTCTALALWEGFKASRGSDGKWSKVLILLLAGALFAVPYQILKLVGLGNSLGCYVLMLQNPGEAGGIYASLSSSGTCAVAP